MDKDKFNEITSAAIAVLKEQGALDAKAVLTVVTLAMELSSRTQMSWALASSQDERRE